MENFTANHGVSFCVVGETQLLPEKFFTRYESVVVSGNAAIVADDTLK